jgi:hypothetical protein
MLAALNALVLAAADANVITLCCIKYVFISAAVNVEFVKVFTPAPAIIQAHPFRQLKNYQE